MRPEDLARMLGRRAALTDVPIANNWLRAVKALCSFGAAWESRRDEVASVATLGNETPKTEPRRLYVIRGADSGPRRAKPPERKSRLPMARSGAPSSSGTPSNSRHPEAGPMARQREPSLSSCPALPRLSQGPCIGYALRDRVTSIACQIVTTITTTTRLIENLPATVIEAMLDYAREEHRNDNPGTELDEAYKNVQAAYLEYGGVALLEAQQRERRLFEGNTRSIKKSETDL
jgi:hypothetical protein